MRNIYFSLLAIVGLVFSVQAQTVPVTIKIDMSDETVGENGVHIAGAFETGTAYGDPINPTLVNWSPSAIELLDDDGDGIYEVTLDLAPANYEYKVINGNDWPDEESIPSACQVELGTGNNNRFFDVVEGATELIVEHCFGKCGPCGMTTVHFRVDMSTQEGTVDPHISTAWGGFVFTELMQWRGSDVYAMLMHFDESFTGGQYLYSTSDGFAGAEMSIEGDCAEAGGRILSIAAEQAEGDILLPLFCFSSCEGCVDPIMVTLTVDMSNVDEVSANGVHVAGNFQGWNPGGTPLSDNGDGTWSATVPMEPGEIQFKFVNGNSWGTDESVPAACNNNGNRFLEIGEDDEELSYSACFGQCSEVCVANPDPAMITFFVDMNAEVVESSGVFLMGGFTTPTWQGGRIQMTETSTPGIYSASATISGPAEFQFKFSNGDPQEGEFADGESGPTFAEDGCGVSNGIGGFNRVHVRSGEPEEIGFVYNTCGLITSVSDISNKLEGIKAFPNPMNQNLTLTFANPGVHQIMIMDITGKMVRNYNNVAQPVFDINRGSLNSGIYVMQIVNENAETATLKIIVQ
jgi:hypothetical protein